MAEPESHTLRKLREAIYSGRNQTRTCLGPQVWPPEQQDRPEHEELKQAIEIVRQAHLAKAFWRGMPLPGSNSGFPRSNIVLPRWKNSV